jgi:hypothetical protein
MLSSTGTLFTDQLVGDRRRELMDEAAFRRLAKNICAQRSAPANDPCSGPIRRYAARLLARLA